MTAAGFWAVFALVPAFAGPKADPDAVRFVELFLKTETTQLVPETIPVFMGIDSATLPARLRDAYRAKRFELMALQLMEMNKGRSIVRRMGQEELNECAGPEPMSRAGLGWLRRMSFREVSEDEVLWLKKHTRCSFCELKTEFSLIIVELPPRRKGGKPELHYLFHSLDPILALLTHYDLGRAPPGRGAFGLGGTPKCRYD